MLNGYSLRRYEHIYLEDLPYIKPPEWTLRQLEIFTPRQDFSSLCRRLPPWISAFIASHYSTGRAFSWMHFLDDIQHGRVVMVRDTFCGEAICSVITGKDNLREGLPLILRQRLTYVLTRNVKRPVYSLGPVQKIIEASAFPALLSDNSQESSSPIPDGVYVWTEVIGAGHAFISVHHNHRIHLYTYGRFGRTGPATLTGDGILNYLIDDDAEQYYLTELYEKDSKVFRIIDADIMLTRHFFERLWDKASPAIPHTDMGEVTRRRGRTIDVYDLSGSNCVTHSVDGIQAAGSQVFKTSYTPMTTQFPVSTDEDFTIPVSLQRYLLKRSKSVPDALVIDSTNDFKKHYPNIDNLKVIETGMKNTSIKLGAEGMASFGSLSDKSVGTVGGVLGSSYDVE